MKTIIMMTILTAIIFSFESETFNVLGYQEDKSKSEVVACDYTLIVNLTEFYFDISARNEDKTVIYTGDQVTNLIYVLEKFTNWTQLARSNKITSAVKKTIERQQVDITFKYGDKYKRGVSEVEYQFFCPEQEGELHTYLIVKSDEFIAKDNQYMTASDDVMYFESKVVNKILKVLYDLKNIRLGIVDKRLKKLDSEQLFK